MASLVLQASLLLFLVAGSLSKCRRITCHFMTSSDLITPNTKGAYDYWPPEFNNPWPTHGIFVSEHKKVCSENSWDKMTCSEAKSRVQRVCLKNALAHMESQHDDSNEIVCSGVMGWRGHWVLDTKIPVFISGKADCAKNDDQETWMVPVKVGEICCSFIRARDWNNPKSNTDEVKGCDMWKGGSECNC